MKTMRPEWRKELRSLLTHKRALEREQSRDDLATHKRIAAEKHSLVRRGRGLARQMFRLIKRARILEGRLSS